MNTLMGVQRIPQTHTQIHTHRATKAKEYMEILMYVQRIPHTHAHTQTDRQTDTHTQIDRHTHATDV